MSGISTQEARKLVFTTFPMGDECSRGIESVTVNPLVHGWREREREKKKPKEDGWFLARRDKFSFGRGSTNCTTDCGLFVSLLPGHAKIVWQVAANKQVSCVGDLERQSCQ